ADGSPKDDLSPYQRWRGRSFLEYQNGKWLAGSAMRVMYARGVRAGIRYPSANSSELPKPVNNEYAIDFRWISRKRDAVIADPLTWIPGEAAPVVSNNPTGNFAWTQMPEGSFFPFTREAVRQYRQIMLPLTEPDVGSVFELMNWAPRLPDDRVNPYADPYAFYDVLTTTKLVSLKDYTRNLLDRLIAEKKLPQEILTRLDPATRNVSAQDHEMVARAISAYIADSGEFEYSLKTPPIEKGLDPVEDFLTRSKVGSCERFATALVQLLRSIGIPCKMIVGFKGAEHLDGGKYYVRQEMAHAWVEVLVRRPTPPGYTSYELPNAVATPTTPGGEVQPNAQTAGNKSERPNIVPPPPYLYAWLSLDPTPGGNDPTLADQGLSGSMKSVWASLGEWFSSLVVNFDPDARRKLSALLWEWTLNWWPYVLISTLIVFTSLILVRLFKRATAKREIIAQQISTFPAWYERFTAISKQRGVERVPSETPLEHARRFAASLPREYDEWTAQVAQVIAAVRYGETVANPLDVEAIEKGLIKLETP
ncbi:MAG: transglutaminase domain-containing protein, partial [Gemmataceae bacterium]